MSIEQPTESADQQPAAPATSLSPFEAPQPSLYVDGNADITNELIPIDDDGDPANSSAVQGLSKSTVRRLSSLSKQIEQQHQEVRRCGTRALMHAVAAGNLLLTAKNELPHGSFTAWVETNFGQGCEGLSIRTCQSYMKIARGYPQLIEYLEANSNTKRASCDAEIQELLDGVSVRKALNIVDESRGVLPQTKQKPTVPSHVSVDRTLPTDGDNLTPDVVLQGVLNLFDKIDLDPCTETSTPHHVPALQHYQESDDGLSADQPWTGNVFIHPPFDSPDAWIARSLREFTAGTIDQALLFLPAHTDAEWFLSLRAFPRGFLRNRPLAVTDGGDHSQAMTEPTVVFFLGESNRVADFARAFAHVADVFVPLTVD